MSKSEDVRACAELRARRHVPWSLDGSIAKSMGASALDIVWAWIDRLASIELIAWQGIAWTSEDMR